MVIPIDSHKDYAGRRNSFPPPQLRQDAVDRQQRKLAVEQLIRSLEARREAQKAKRIECIEFPAVERCS